MARPRGGRRTGADEDEAATQSLDGLRWPGGGTAGGLSLLASLSLSLLPVPPYHPPSLPPSIHPSISSASLSIYCPPSLTPFLSFSSPLVDKVMKTKMSCSGFLCWEASAAANTSSRVHFQPCAYKQFEHVAKHTFSSSLPTVAPGGQ